MSSWYDPSSWFRWRTRFVVVLIGPLAEQVGKVRPSWKHYSPARGVIMTEVPMTDNQFTTIRLGQVVDKRGNPTPTQPTGGWTFLVDQPAVLLVEPAADGLSCKCSSMGILGDATVTIKSVDGTVGPIGVHFTIGPGPGANVQVNVDPPAEQP